MTQEEIMCLIEDCLSHGSCVTCPQDRAQCDQGAAIRWAAALIETISQERDAAIADLKRADVDCDFCAHAGCGDEEACEAADVECLICTSERCVCRTCVNMSKWTWRGVQREDTCGTTGLPCARCMPGACENRR